MARIGGTCTTVSATRVPFPPTYHIYTGSNALSRLPFALPYSPVGKSGEIVVHKIHGDVHTIHSQVESGHRFYAPVLPGHLARTSCVQRMSLLFPGLA